MNVFSPQVLRSTGPQVHTTSYKLMFPVHQFSGPQVHIGSISAALSCLVYPPFPEQRLVIEPKVHTTSYKSISPVHRSSGLQVHHFGSRIKHSYLHTYGELVCKEFSRVFFSSGNYWRLHASKNCRKFVFCWWAIRVNHGGEHLCRVAILNPFESYLLWRANKRIGDRQDC